MVQDTGEIVVHVVEHHVEIGALYHHFEEGNDIGMLKGLKKTHFANSRDRELIYVNTESK